MIRSSAPDDMMPAHQRIEFRDSIDWDELSALGAALAPVLQPVPVPNAAEQVAAAARFNLAWTNTLPADLGETPKPQPFSEPLQGMVMREMNEPDVFRHFFG